MDFIHPISAVILGRQAVWHDTPRDGCVVHGPPIDELEGTGHAETDEGACRLVGVRDGTAKALPRWEEGPSWWAIQGSNL